MDIMTFIVPFIIGSVLGLAIGAIITLLFTGGKTEKEETPAPKPVELLPEGISRSKHVDVVRLWHERAGSQLVVEVDGKVLPESGSLSAGQRSALESAIREWAAWLGLGKAPAKPAAAPAAVEKPPVAAPPPQVRPAPVVVPGVSAVAVPPVVPAEVRPKSMVEQIDEIVQEMLPASPLAGHTLRVRSDIKEGVLVWLDGKRYFGIGEVDDPQAKAILQAAAAEWEARTARERGWI